jgi:hypothetical protein
MQNPLFEKLYTEGLISKESLHMVNDGKASNKFSLFWEFKTVLYVGVLSLSTGLGILVYKNIDTIGHQIILIFIAAISMGCLWYCYKKKRPFNFRKVKAPNALFDYILLLGVLMLLVFIGYLQLQYDVFGSRYGLATFIPMVVLFLCAYYFDHLGILTMAVANLAIWMGVTTTPNELLKQIKYDDERFIYTYLLLGVFLLTAGYTSKRYDIKKHFGFTYDHYGIHVTYIAMLSGFYYYDYAWSLLWVLPLALLCWYVYQLAYNARSLYFVLLTVMYGYIGISGLLVRPLLSTNNPDILQLVLLYFLASGAALVLLVIYLNKSIKNLKTQAQHVSI